MEVLSYCKDMIQNKKDKLKLILLLLILLYNCLFITNLLKYFYWYLSHELLFIYNKHIQYILKIILITPISSLFRRNSFAYESDCVTSCTQHSGSIRNICNSFGKAIILNGTSLCIK